MELMGSQIVKVGAVAPRDAARGAEKNDHTPMKGESVTPVPATWRLQLMRRSAGTAPGRLGPLWRWDKLSCARRSAAVIVDYTCWLDSEPERLTLNPTKRYRTNSTRLREGEAHVYRQLIDL